MGEFGAFKQFYPTLPEGITRLRDLQVPLSFDSLLIFFSFFRAYLICSFSVCDGPLLTTCMNEQVESCGFDFHGWLVWTWDCVEQVFYVTYVVSLYQFSFHCIGHLNVHFRRPL